MEDFDERFRAATRQIPQEYFLLPVMESPAIYRERVYCYELYHQLRLIWPSDTPYRLNGEIDKRGHYYFADEAGAPKPDLLIHVPGQHDNFAVIEVKTVENLRKQGVTKDIGTLTQFTNDFGYRRGIHLLVGAPAAETLDLLRRAGTDPNAFGRIEFWGHTAPGLAAERPS